MCVVSATIQQIDCQQDGKEKHTDCRALVLCCVIVGSVCSNEDKPTIKLLVACNAAALQQGARKVFIYKEVKLCGSQQCVVMNL